MKDEKITDDYRHIAHLKDQLQKFGLPEPLVSLIDYHYRVKISEFTIPYWLEEAGSLTLIELNYATNKTGQCNLDSIDFSYRPPIDIKEASSGDANTIDLDRKMASINWTYDHFLITIVEAEMETEEGRKRLDDISDTLNQLDGLYESSPQGKSIAQLLMYKHWVKGYYHKFVSDLTDLKRRYEYSCSVRLGEDTAISFPKMIEQLKEQSKSAHQILNPIINKLAPETGKKPTKKRKQSL